MKFPPNAYTLFCDPEGNWFVVGTQGTAVLFIANEEQRVDLLIHSYATIQPDPNYFFMSENYYIEYYKKTPFSKRKILPEHVQPTLSSYTFKDIVDAVEEELREFHRENVGDVVFVGGLPRYAQHENYVPDGMGGLAPPDAKFDLKIRSIEVIEDE